ncbi:hypothetical protein AGMMS49959_19030 [Planctomycetales bacterium]|nr:hypothetical protein AGMMS49959_19030 [Planctomycetales bacterium]
MKIHYFQRYHSKENVDTANAMLLLSRLYSYSPNKFYQFLGNLLPKNANVELLFNIQEKIKCGTIPDATITQSSFKIAIETKLSGGFTLKQLVGHLDSFGKENYKVLLTLDPSPFNEKLTLVLKPELVKHMCSHKHLTFEQLAAYVSDVIDDRDYEMQDIVNEYKEYCYESGLIPDDWKRMRMQLAGTTININKQLNLYYDAAGRGFSGHDYLGLYSQKAVRAIGKLTAIATAEVIDDKLKITTERGTVSDEMKDNILIAIEDAKNYGYDLQNNLHRYFFVDSFIDTLFEKTTKGAPMGSRLFNLCEVLDTDALPDVSQIAQLLKAKTWG